MSESVIVFDDVSKSYPGYQHVTGGIKNFLFHLPKAIKSRLENFKRSVMPIINKYYRGRVVKIDGTGTKRDVWERVLAAVK